MTADSDGLDELRLDVIRARLKSKREDYAVHVGCGGECVEFTPGRYTCQECGVELPRACLSIAIPSTSGHYVRDVAWLLEHLDAATDPTHERRELHRRMLDILGWQEGTEEQALEALAGIVQSARTGRNHDVYWQRNEAWAERDRLRRELREAREAVGAGWGDVDGTLAEAIRRKAWSLGRRLESLIDGFGDVDNRRQGDE